MLLKKIFILFASIICANSLIAQQQDTTDILSKLENDAAKESINYTTATFKTTRLVNGHTVENVSKGVMDVRFNHRFGTINKGAYELFGLDNATTRFGFDYGITNNLMVGIGRSSYQKTFDAFFKLKLLRQSTGKKNIPVTVSYVPTIAVNTLKWANDSSRKNYFSSRLSYTHQLIIARKFSENLSLQIMPTYVHRNLTTLASSSNDVWAMGIGGRQKISKRTSFDIEYYYQFDKEEGITNSLSLGFDIETGGHVFQLHITNSNGMTEKNFITNTTGKWNKGDLLFGFNISRVFNVGKKH
jgi:hypothetical protein